MFGTGSSLPHGLPLGPLRARTGSPRQPQSGSFGAFRSTIETSEGAETSDFASKWTLKSPGTRFKATV